MTNTPITSREFSLLDAPPHLNNSEASAWASGAEHGYQACQAHNDAVIASKDMAIENYESKIAARDEALQGANAVIAELVEALEVMTPIYNQLAWIAVCWNDHNFDANSIYTKINTAFNDAGFKRGDGVEHVNNFVEKLESLIAKHKKV